MIAALIVGSAKLMQRRYALSELALQNAQQLVRVRLDALTRELVEDLREEAAAIGVPDTVLLRERWFPLMDSHWQITAIRLADEYGNELAVIRTDSAFIVSRTAHGSKEGPPILMAYALAPDHRVTSGPWLQRGDNDPRERVWFSKALEDIRNEPIWSLHGPDSIGAPVLQASYLIRGEERDQPYRIIGFTADIGRSTWFDTRQPGDHQPTMLLFDDQGRSLMRLDSNAHKVPAQAGAAALSTWNENKTRGTFPVQVDGSRYLALVGSYPLHGQVLNLGVVIDPRMVDMWIDPERYAIIMAAVLLATLTALLIWAWIRKRSSDERNRKQAKRNRSQELKLAKALGEREVLNREVHHRVKNNLQVVSSLLNLQATRLEDGAVKSEFLRGKRRIDTIALVHHKLYGLSDLRNVDLSRFCNDLVTAISALYAPKSRSVSHEIDTDGIKADQDTAIELGIILCELVGNTYQHAFPYATGGHVEIRIRRVEGDLYRLTVKDNGKGIPEGDQHGSGKLGLEIVEALCEQLDGSFHMTTNPGVQFEVLFRMQRTPTPAQPQEEVAR
ncbi:MAG TPA: sensor histidine kinase [Flavobacteriales bacterium]|nr:sensor histidine kinase [Flavobacteriales bacterium]